MDLVGWVWGPGLAGRAGTATTGPGEAGAEGEGEGEVAAGDPAFAAEPGERERHRGGGGVAGVDDVVGDHRVRGADLTSERVDDPQIGLVRNDGGELGGVDAGRLADGQRDLTQRRGRPTEDRRPVEPKPVLGVHVDQPRGASVAAEHDRPDSRLVRRAHDGGAGAVTEQDRRRAVRPVEPVGDLLGTDDDGVVDAAQPDRVGRG